MTNENTTFKPTSFSRTTITELMVPSYANFGGKIHGGIILSLMDKVAYACATRHAGNYCVTVNVDAVDFLEPIEVGDLVSLMASVNWVGRTSMVVGIKVIAENVKFNSVRHTNTSYFTMVAKGEDNKPAQVPGLILENHEDVRRFITNVKKQALKKSYTTQMAALLDEMGHSHELGLLENQRCKIDLVQ